jgi:hypothetical protein
MTSYWSRCTLAGLAMGALGVALGYRRQAVRG